MKTPFSKQLDRQVQEVKRRERLLYKAVTNHAFRSIRFGSDVTGAPGQPVDTGALLRSWKLRRGAGRKAIMESDIYHAPIIEDNRRGARLRSKVGGFHSVRLTRMGWNRIVQFELRKIKGGGSGEPDPGMSIPRVGIGRMRDERGRFIGNKTRLDVD